MKILLMVAMAMIGGKARAERGVALEHVVPVCMSEGVRTPDMYLEWRSQEPLCRSLNGVISIRLSDDTPIVNSQGRLAYALPFEGTPVTLFQITVFYDRVRRTVQPPVVPYLLAHVLAHEIAHIIEGTNRHSDGGVMKAHWDLIDLHQMYRKPLPFTEFDVVLIHKGLEARP